MQMLGTLAATAEKRTDAGRRYGLEKLVTQFGRSLAGELDYRREARNLLRFGELTSRYDRLVVPQPVADLTTSRVLTMDWIEGRKVTDVGPLGLMEVDTGPIVDQLFRAYLHSILHDGFVHADPHPGNLLLTDDGRLALLDLGMTASVPPRIQNDIIKLLLSVSDGDGEETAAVLASMGHPLDDFDPAAFRDDVSHLVSEALASGSDVSVGTVMMDLSRLSGQHGLRPPAEMSMVGKALLNLDRATSHLDPDFAPAVAIRTNVSEIFAAGLKVSAGGLIAAAIESKHDAKRLDQLGLCKTRNTDEQRVAACQQRDQRALDHRFLTEDDLAGCLTHRGNVGERGFRLRDHFAFAQCRGRRRSAGVGVHG